MYKSVWMIFISLIISSFAHADFLPGTEDIPLIDGMVLEDANDFTFDSPMGQVLTLSGTTSDSPKKVQAFYDETLTALGWTKESEHDFRRGTDALRLTIQEKGEITQILFDITLSTPEP